MPPSVQLSGRSFHLSNPEICPNDPSHPWARRLVVFDRLKLRIVAVAIPRRLESQHLLITGGTGAGKSQTLYGLLDTLRKRGEPAILTDTGAEARYYFGRPTDRLPMSLGVDEGLKNKLKASLRKS